MISVSDEDEIFIDLEQGTLDDDLSIVRVNVNAYTQQAESKGASKEDQDIVPVCLTLGRSTQDFFPPSQILPAIHSSGYKADKGRDMWEHVHTSECNPVPLGAECCVGGPLWDADHC